MNNPPALAQVLQKVALSDFLVLCGASANRPQVRLGRMPSIPVYIRKANYEKIRRRAEASGKSIGKIINELIQQMN